MRILRPVKAHTTCLLVKYVDPDRSHTFDDPTGGICFSWYGNETSTNRNAHGGRGPGRGTRCADQGAAGRRRGQGNTTPTSNPPAGADSSSTPNNSPAVNPYLRAELLRRHPRRLILLFRRYCVLNRCFRDIFHLDHEP